MDVHVVLPQDAAGLTEVRPSEACNQRPGLFATRALEPFTRLGTYPGVVKTGAQASQTSKHAVAFFCVSDGALDDDYVVDPERRDGSIYPRFECNMLYVNEPPLRQRQNVIMVWDFVKYTVDLYTWTRVRAGQELFLLYGNDYHAREYAITSRPPASLFALTSGAKRPAPIAEAKGVPPRIPEDKDGCDGVVFPFEDLKVARVGAHPSKGMALYASRNIPAWKPIAAYPGRVFHVDDFQRKYPGQRRTYAVDFFHVRADRSVREDLIIDPGHPDHPDRLDPLFESYVAPRVNEPSAGEAPNAVWVRDLEGGLLWLYSYARGVKSGDEITVMYGSSYGKRAYAAVTHAPVHTDRKLYGTKITVSPAYGYDILWPGLVLHADDGDFPLDRVHPRGWYDLDELLKSSMDDT